MLVLNQNKQWNKKVLKKQKQEVRKRKDKEPGFLQKKLT